MPIHSGSFVIGRKPESSLHLTSKSVSGIHAEIFELGDSLVLRDAGSTNGTYLNGQRLSSAVELTSDDLVHFADVAFRVVQQSKSANCRTMHEDVMEQAMSLVRFDKLMSEEGFIPHYQPIVDLGDESTVGLEVLVRSRVSGLETPMALFSAAGQLSVETQLSQMIRSKAVAQTAFLEAPPHLFLNTHPMELQTPGLVQSVASLRKMAPSQKITMEIHEKAVSDAAAMQELKTALADLNVGLAFDDFGAGQTRLIELSKVHPEYLKFDMSLIRSIHTASDDHRQMVATLVAMVREMGIVALAEGIECKEEAEACMAMGFELGQGFYFGKPLPLAAQA